MWAAVLTPVDATGSYLMTEVEPVLVLGFAPRGALAPRLEDDDRGLA